jgi:pimeloyl-ACP methyl ester carboxylesterase
MLVRRPPGTPGSPAGTLVVMVWSELPPNPDALHGADPARVRRCRVNGTTLHVEVRGSGPALLIIHGGGEDAEVWRPVAERLEGFTVVTYDRRGTQRSGRDGWPGDGSAQHADDAAALLRAFQLNEVVVFGPSSAGIVALQLALRHPTLVRRSLVFEPGLFRQLPGEDPVGRPVQHAIERHLAARPGDWVGALAVFRHAVGTAMGPAADDLVAPPPGKEWYARREEENAEAFVRDDVQILTRERVDEADLAAAGVDIQFSFGTGSMPVFRAITTQLAAVRNARPIAVQGVGHVIYYDADAAAAYLRAQAADSSEGR